jgi:hypothetical protein
LREKFDVLKLTHDVPQQEVNSSGIRQSFSTKPKSGSAKEKKYEIKNENWKNNEADDFVRRSACLLDEPASRHGGDAATEVICCGIQNKCDYARSML